MTPHFEDFHLIINGSDGQYTVEARGREPQPLDLRAAEGVEEELARIRRGERPSLERMSALGGYLFDMLFPRAVLRTFERVSGSLPPENRLRLKLTVRPPELSRLPWELLYDPEGSGRFLSALRSHSVVRFIESDAALRPLQVEGPLRVLHVQASPPGTDELDLLQSEQTLRETVGQRAEILLLRHPTQEELREALRHPPGFHVLHYDGHAAVGEGQEGGYLVLHSEEGGAAPLPGEMLARYLVETPVRLVVLSACHSGLDAVQRRFSGIAQRLMRDNPLPAVVAMQFALSDAAAIAFNRGFYSALVEGYPVDMAVTEGRLAIMELAGGLEGPCATADWAAPLLLMRSEDGALFEMAHQGATDKEGESWRRAYLHHLLEDTRHLSLAGVDRKTAHDPDARLHLDAVYTTLLTLTPEQEERLKRGDRPEGEGRLRSALAQLDRHAHLVLLGDPGSGKSTFINFVAMCLAGEALGHDHAHLQRLTAPLMEEGDGSGEAQPWSHGVLLPVRVILRDFAARGLPEIGVPATADSLWRFIVEGLEADALGEFVPYLRRDLMERGGLLLLDGLDEVPEANQRRTQIKEAVEDFVRSFSRCRVLVTSRTYAYQEQAWRLPDFTAAILAPFNAAQIRCFVEAWYEHISALRGMDPEDARGRATLLMQAIVSNDRLHALAERPLLLTLMASLHAWRSGSLPEKREELYADTVDLLLDQWEQQRVVRDAQGQVKLEHPSLAEFLQVGRDTVRALLERLAYEAHAGQPDLQGTADIEELALVGQLIELSPNPDIRPKQLVKYLSERAGLLVPRGVGVYTFPHRTLQEYLAACYLTSPKSNYPDTLVTLVREDPNRWREVVLLAGAKAARGVSSAFWDLIHALCYREPEPASPMEDRWSAFLAGQALVETVELNWVSERYQPWVERVARWQLRLLRDQEFPATERVAAGVALARLGDPRAEVVSLERMPFCYVPAGPFWMGSPPEDEEAYEDERPLHRADLSYPYWMARFPITNAQFHEFVRVGGYGVAHYWQEALAAGVWSEGRITSKFELRPRSAPYDFGPPFTLPNHPVVGVTWYEALAFTHWLTEQWREAGLLPPGYTVLLPSEAEWEKAARGGLEIPNCPIVAAVGTVRRGMFREVVEALRRGALREAVGVLQEAHLSPHPIAWAELPLQGEVSLMSNPVPLRRYPWGNEVGIHRANSEELGLGRSSAVGAFPGGASPYGCEEMSGNVYEWTRSLRGGYPYPTEGESRAAREWLESQENLPRVLRGGSYYVGAQSARCAFRFSNRAYYRFVHGGFRVALVADASAIHPS